MDVSIYQTEIILCAQKLHKNSIRMLVESLVSFSINTSDK